MSKMAFWGRGQNSRHRYSKLSLKVFIFVGILAFLGVGGAVFANLGGILKTTVGASDVRLQAGMVGHWKMNGNAKDATPYSNDGSVTNSTLTTDRKGAANQAYSFNGSSTSIGVTSAAPLQQIGDMSISVWVKPTNDGNYDPIISKWDGTTGEYELAADFRTGQTRLSWRSTNAAGSNIDNFFTGYTGVWVHVSAVVIGTNVTMYRNGVNMGTVAIGTRTATSNQFNIGRRVSQSFWFNGPIDDVRIYKRAINATEVTALYKQYDAQTNLAHNEGQLAGWWPFDGNAKDATPHAYDGTVNGAALTTDRKGIASKAYSFNGSSDYISTPSVSITGNSFSASAWFKSTSAGDKKIISTGANKNLLQVWTSGAMRICVNGCTVGTINVSDSLWHFAVVVGDATSIRLYLDGNSTPEITQTALGATAIGGVINFGRDVSTTSYYYTGSIDEPRIYNRVLSTTEIATMYKSYGSQLGGGALSQNLSLSSGLVGYWPLNNGNAKDATPYRNNGTVTAATLTTDRNSRANSAYNFNGSSAVIDTGMSMRLDKFTWSLWINSSSNGGGARTPISTTRDCCGVYNGFSFEHAGYGGPHYVLWHNGTATALQAGTTAATGTWTHFAGTYDGTTMVLYKDGSQIGTNNTYAGTVGVPSYSLKIGACGSGGCKFAGDIDDVHVYSRALSSAEITALYNEYR